MHDQAEIVDLAAERVRRKLMAALAEIELWNRARTERDELRQPVHDWIDAELAKEFGAASYETDHPDHDAFKSERRKRRARATREATRTICARFGFEKLPAAPRNHMLKVPTGLGKTHQALEAIARTTTLRFDFFLPSHTLLDQSRGNLKAMVPDRAIGTARGRAARDPKARCVGHPLTRSEWDPGAMCPRHAVVGQMAAAGMNANQEICPSCPLKDVCGYRAQRRELGEIREDGGPIFEAAAYLQHNALHPRGDIALIDEDFILQMFGIKVLNVAMLRDPAAAFRLFRSEDIERGSKVLELLYRALVEHAGASIEFLRSHGIDHDRLKETKKAVEKGQGKDPDLNGTMTDSEISQRLQAITTAGRREIIALVRKVMRAKKADSKRMRSIRLIGDAADPTLEITTASTFRIPKRQAVIILDATASLPLIELATGRTFNVIEARVPENLDVTTVDTSGSKLAIHGGAIKDAPGDDETVAADIVRDGVLKAFESFAAGRECPLITHKATEELWLDELPANMPTMHFGDLVGRNDFESCDQLMILGRQQPHENQLIPMAAALAETQGRDITTIDDWLDQCPEHRAQRRFDGYLNCPTDDGGFNDRFAWHPDPIVEAMRWRACEGELIQAIGRLHSIRSEKPKKLLLITNVVVPGIVPNRVISYRERALADGDEILTCLDWLASLRVNFWRLSFSRPAP
ncbi:MAG: DEAD/DEAH box helicase family protein [Pseudomonadota bacterium]